MDDTFFKLANVKVKLKFCLKLNLIFVFDESKETEKLMELIVHKKVLSERNSSEINNFIPEKLSSLFIYFSEPLFTIFSYFLIYKLMNIPITKKAIKARGLDATPAMWIQDKADYDSMLWGSPKKYWIIDNKMYDLSEFCQKHPGGSNWITLTQGHDISEHFQVHHLNYKKAKQMLEKYYVGECPNKQKPRFTFEEEGLFQTVKKKILNKYTVEELSDSTASERRAMVLFSIWFLLISLTGYLNSYILALLTGFFTLVLNGVAHNFVHKKPNLYRHLYLLSGFTAKEWEIMHCISHHIYTNTLLDYELGGFEPLMYYHRCLPKNHKFSFIFIQIISLTISISNVLLKLLIVPLKSKSLPDFSYLCTLLQIPLLFIFNGSFKQSILLFIAIHLSFGFLFGKSVYCGHRIPETWTEGAEEIREFGLHTIMTTVESSSLAVGYKSLLFYTGFNIHSIHHFFPTIDHEHLKKVDLILREVCKERGVKLFQNAGLVDCNKKIYRLYGEKVPFVMKVEN